MTWNPPPEKDRPDGYTCLGYSSPWNGYPSFWTECVWHKESQSWFSVEDWKMEPTTFAPLPEVATAARIAELEAEIERLRKSRRDAVYRFMLGIVLSEEGCDTPKANGEVGLCFIRPGQSCICRAKAAALTNRVLMAITVAMEDTP
jgi:hypothetical protein